MLDKILTFIADKLQDLTTLQTPKFTSSVNAGASAVRYIKFGKIVIFTGVIVTNTSLSAGTILATDFPLAYVANIPFEMKDNNSFASNLTAYLNNDGTGKLRIASATSGNRSWRISGAYIAA